MWNKPLAFLDVVAPFIIWTYIVTNWKHGPSFQDEFDTIYNGV